MSLTVAGICTLKTGDRTERLVADSNGLYLRLGKVKGDIARTFHYRRREAGKLSVVTLGTYPHHVALPNAGGWREHH